MNRWFRVIADDNSKGIYERFIAHILDSLTEGDPSLEPYVNKIDVMGFISGLVDDDELWTPVDEYLMNKLKEKIKEENQMYKSNEQGRCPYCNEYELEYGAAEFQDDGMMFYPWTCEHCGHSGEEWYKLNFEGHNDEEGNIIELEGGE